MVKKDATTRKIFTRIRQWQGIHWSVRRERGAQVKDEQSRHMAVTYDATTLDRYLDDDLALIKNTNVWKEYKRGAQNKDDVCYIYKPSGDSIWWIKLVAYVENSSLANIDDLLDASLKERHPEWHELYIDGRVLRKNDDGRSEICYFQ
jgi:hypothetical protein